MTSKENSTGDVMTKGISHAQGRKMYSDNLFSLLGELSGEVAQLPIELQKKLNSVADRLMAEVFSNAEFERIEPETRTLQ
ncbi:MAG: hypothetical protein MI749_17990 [Desulfovibrionales bacterium]|nr:hypothetical protein [Desulfovibrionales bacterium]